MCESGHTALRLTTGSVDPESAAELHQEEIFAHTTCLNSFSVKLQF